MTVPAPEMSDDELHAALNPDLTGLTDILPPLAPPDTIALSTWSQLPTPPGKREQRQQQRIAETNAVAHLKPEHRRIAEYRAQGLKPAKIGELLNRSGQSVSDVLKLPHIKLALLYFNRTLAEKAMANRHLAANMLPRALEKTGAMLEQDDLKPRDLNNMTKMLASVAGATQESQADPAANTVIINLSPDAARQMMAQAGPGRASDVEWEEIVVEPDEKVEEDA